MAQSISGSDAFSEWWTRPLRSRICPGLRAQEVATHQVQPPRVHGEHPAGDDGQVLVPIPTAIGQAKPASQNLPAPLTTRPCVGRVRSGLRYRLQPCCILIPVPGGCNRRPVVVLRTVTLADAQQFRTGRWSFHHWNRSVHIATCDHVRNLATAQ